MSNNVLSETGPIAPVKDSGNFFSGVLQDIRYALRTLCKSPGFTAVAAPHPRPRHRRQHRHFFCRGYCVVASAPFQKFEPAGGSFRDQFEGRREPGPSTPADFRDWRDRSNVFEELVAWRMWSYSVEGTSHAEEEEVLGTRVSAAFFRMVGVKPYLGRAFSTGEEQVGRDHVVVLSYGFWQLHFAAARDVIGKNLTIDGKPFVIVGVLPASFRFLPTRHVDLWMPFAFTASDLKRDNHSIAVCGRLKSGINLRSSAGGDERDCSPVSASIPQY